MLEVREKKLNPLEQRIKEKIHLFDIAALLQLLSRFGYKATDIYFVSNSSLSSAPSLCEEIIFSDVKYPRITLVINLGLMVGNSPMPTFFRKKMDEGTIDPLLFARFLSFFDHHIIMTLLSMSIPTDNGWFFSDWNETLNQYLNLLGLNSVSTLQLLFQLCFPELRANVHKFARVLRTQSSFTTLGVTLLGKDSFLSKNQKITISSFKILLYAEELETDLSIPWAKEVKKRLRDLLFPILKRINIYLQVILIVRNSKDIARLAVNSHLGYRSLGKTDRPLKILLFAGYPKK